MISALSVLLRASQTIIGLSCKLIFFSLRLILILPYIYFTKTMGAVKGTLVYAVYAVVLLFGFAKYVEYQKEQVPVAQMQDFRLLSSDKRAELIEMAEIAACAYQVDDGGSSRRESLANRGYILRDSNSGSQGPTYIVLEKGDVVYLAFRGSASLNDWDIDMRMLLYPDAKQWEEHWDPFRKAVEIARGVQSEYAGRKLVLVGHSLGGAMAQYVVSELKDSGDVSAFVFNALGIPGKTDTVQAAVTSVIHEADIAQLVMEGRRLEGGRIIVRGKYTLIGNKDVGLFDLFTQHSIENTLKNMNAQHAQVQELTTI